MLQRLMQHGLYLVLVLLPFQTRYLLIESANPFGTVSVYLFDLVIVAVGVLWLWNWYKQPAHHINWTALTTALALLIVAGCASYFANDQRIALYYWLHLALGLWLLAMIATSKLNHTILLGVLIFNGAVQAVMGMVQFITQHVIASKWLGMAVQLPELSGASVVMTTAGRWLRAYAFLPHPNIAGGVMVLGLIAAAYLSKRYWQLAIVGGLVSFGLVLTFSRGAFISWCLLLVVLVIARRVRASFILTVLATIIISLTVYWPLVTSRTSTTQFTEQLSISERQQQLEQFQTIFKTRWPFGVGLGQYTVTAEPISPLNYAQPIHNLFLMWLVELGILGTVLCFSLIAQPIWKLKYRLIDHPASYLLLGVIFLGMFDHYWWTLPSFTILWCALIGWLWLQIPQHQPKVTEASAQHK